MVAGGKVNTQSTAQLSRGTFPNKDVKASETALLSPIVWNFNTDTHKELRPQNITTGSSVLA